MSPKLRIFTATTLGLLALDQATKVLVRATLAPYSDEVTLIPGLLSFTHAQNKGAAMSMLADYEHRLWFFGVFTVIATGILLWTLRHFRAEDRLGPAAVGILLSGALGNFIDRMAFGQVTDMIKFQLGFEPARTWARETFGTSVYPIFNVADIAIWVGVGLFLVGYLFQRDEPVEDVGPPVDLGA